MNAADNNAIGSQKWWTIVIFVMVLAMGAALALFVNRATTQIREALAEEVLQQQHDVSNLLHEYEGVMLAVERERNGTTQVEGALDRALGSARLQLDKMRFQYSFERLDGAATAHAYVKPVMEDVAQWIKEGVPGQSIEPAVLLSLAAQRLNDRYATLRAIAAETDQVATVLIADQSDYLNRFRGSLISLLGFYALLALGFAALLIRQRNLQTQLRMDQQDHAQRIADFADIGADWFWEMNDNLKLKVLSNQDLTVSDNSGGVSQAEEMSVLLASDERATGVHWPVENLLEQRQFSEYESEWVTPEGERRVIAMSGKPLLGEQGEFIGFRGIGRDITIRKKIEQELKSVYQELLAAQRQGRQQAEEALRDSEQFLRTSLDAIAPNIAILDKNATIKAANKAWRELSAGAVSGGGVGHNYMVAFQARPAEEQRALTSVKKYFNAVLNGEQDSFHYEFPCQIGEDTCWMEINLTTFYSNAQRYAVLVYEDITAKRKLEDRDRKLRADLAHVARLNTAGEMASVLAHEINQPLTAISHNCDSLLSNLTGQSESDVEETLQDIYEQSQRAGGIIHSMRQMMRKDAPQTASVNINRLVKETNRLTMPEAREHNVEVKLDLAEDLPETMIDAVQIQQVLVNLERNAVEAIRYHESAVRELTIKTELEGGNWIHVSVSDTGPGITPQVESNLFKSFQTTKVDGMGMGLSISRSIVEAHGGRLWLDHTTQGMTTFMFSFPIKKSVDNGIG